MTFNHKTGRLFLDMDGVLADFDKAAVPMMDGMDPANFEAARGSDEFWKRIHTNPNFFLDLDLMEDALELYDAVKHLRPVILTGIPKEMEGNANQKQDWALKHFGKEQLIVCCRAKKKSDYCLPGDVLVDDRTVYKHYWERKGGVYVVHKNAKNSLDQLKELGVL